MTATTSPATPDAPATVRLAEALAALSLAADAGNGFASRSRCAMRSSPCELTDREVEVLGLLARGLTNKQIAGAAMFAMEHGLVGEAAF